MKKATAILTADWHLRETQPACRGDDFWKHQWARVCWVMDLAEKHGCPVFHAGDLFHHWKPSPNLMWRAWQEISGEFITIYGNHDLPRHNFSMRDYSGLHALASMSDTVQDITDGVASCDDAPFGLWDTEERAILFFHRLIFPSGQKPLWAQLATESHECLDRNPNIDLIVTGDNHQHFTVLKRRQLLVNPGSLTAQTVNELDQVQSVYLWYAGKNTVEEVPIEPLVHSDEVMAVEYREREVDQEADDRRQKAFEAFTQSLSGASWDSSVSFKDRLLQRCKAENVEENVKESIIGAFSQEEEEV